jgi:hypothetical protein
MKCIETFAMCLCLLYQDGMQRRLATRYCR